MLIRETIERHVTSSYKSTRELNNDRHSLHTHTQTH